MAGSEKNLNELKSSVSKRANKNLQIAALNVVWLHRYLCEVEHSINEHKFQLLGLNETRSSEDIKGPEVDLEGFEIHSKDRNVNRCGVAIYVNSRISHNRRYDIDDPLLEVVAVEILPTHARSYIFICWYRLPTPESDKDRFVALRKLLSAVDAEGKEIILVGDANCNLKYHRNGCTTSIKSIYSEFQFQLQIEEYNRVSTLEKDGVSHTSRTPIYHFATNTLTNRKQLSQIYF